MIQAGGPELGLMLWESRGTMISLLEVCSCPYIPCGNSIFLKAPDDIFLILDIDTKRTQPGYFYV